MMITNILVPVDSSPFSKRVLTYSLQFARDLRAKLTVLYIRPIILLYFSALGPEGRPVYLDGELEYRHTLETALKELDFPSDCVNQIYAAGYPASLIIETAKEERSSLILMGSEGFGLLKSILFGYDNYSVIKQAPCPVLIIK
jgi:nucleotide-binding universal stress UspA family protein